MFDIAAAGAAPAQVARLFARFQSDDDPVEPIAHLLESLTQRHSV
jgi:hypothetical protein